MENSLLICSMYSLDFVRAFSWTWYMLLCIYSLGREGRKEGGGREGDAYMYGLENPVV